MKPEISVESDIVVAGGGLAGTFAAIAAARLGCRTVLLQDRSVLGGNASSELAVGISGADCSGHSLARYARETGLIAEFALELLERSRDYASAVPLHSLILWEMVKREPNLELYLNTSLRSASAGEGGLITAVRACRLSDEREYVFSGKLFIDCTGHGTLGAAAGADFRMGREARSEFGESRAPAVADRGTMGDSLLFRARDTGRPAPFAAPDWAARFPTDDSLPFRHPQIEKIDQRSDEAWGYWWIEYGGQRDTIEDAEKIHDELLRILFGVWDHMKNTGDHGVGNYALTWIAPLPSRRESRRLLGDYIMTENDARNRVLFPDRVAYSGWSIDLHPPEGIYAKEPPSSHVTLPDVCSIPFRSLYSRNVPNLLFAGRDVSVTHVALGTVRVMATCAVMGQAAGTAAALCSRHNIMPRALHDRLISALQQQLLKDDCYIVGVRNEDAGDIARHAEAAASSEQTLDVSRADSWHEMTLPCAQIFPASALRLETIELFMRSELDEPVTQSLILKQADGINDFESEREIVRSEAVIGAREEGWVRFNLNIPVRRNCFYRVHLPAMPGLFWAVQASPALGVNRAFYQKGKEPEWRSFTRSSGLGDQRGVFLFRLRPESKPYGPGNVLSGVTRPEAWTNIWISDPNNPMPQWLELRLPQEAVVDTIQITFDDDLETNIYLPPPWGRLGQGIPESLVKDYRVLARLDDEWKELFAARRNHQRRRTHRFAAVRTDRIRLECLATNGSTSARVYEIRVYGAEP